MPSLDPSGGPPGFRLIHQALLYSSDEEYLAATAGFARDGLRQGDPVLITTTPSNIVLLQGELGRDAAAAEFIDSSEWHQVPPWTLAAYHRYITRHAPASGRVRVVGEPVWSGRNACEVREWTRFESVLNVALAASPAWIICLYDTRILPSGVTAGAVRTHPELLEASGRMPSPGYVDPAQLSAQWDRDELPEPPADLVEEMAFTGRDLREVRVRVLEHARATAVPEERAQGLALAANEVATNAVTHGGGRGVLRMWAQDDEAVCEISDDGGRMDHAFPGYLPPTLDSVDGFGLWMARQLCTLVQIRSVPSGTVVRMHVSTAA
ncbi:MAG: anti-sigma factor RsbA family regulatory protein [Carbonactinosporaceae bacterium]